jgi:hypothetical protein
MADTTKRLAEQSFFVYTRDNNTNKIKRMAIPSDVQVGLAGNPAELQLLGRLSLSVKDYNLTVDNKGIVYVDSNDTVVSVTQVDVPTSGRATVILPKSPRNGQIHFIKDVSGTADVTPIDIQSSHVNGLIDLSGTKIISQAYGTLAIYWSNDHWAELVVSQTSGSGGSGVNDATYVTLSNNSTLTHERRLNLSGTNLTLTDNGPNSTVVLDLSTILGGGAGSFTYASLTVDTFGRITAAASGVSPPSVSASYITVVNEGSLTSERQLVVGSGLILTDGGPNASITASINNGIVATLTGSVFSGPVVATGGLSGSVQNIASGQSFLIAGTNVTIVSQSNGQVVINSSGGGGSGSGADPNASYVTLTTTGSLPNERALTAGTGIAITDNGAGSTVVINARPYPGIPAVTLALFHGVVTTNQAHSANRLSIGSTYYNYATLSSVTGSRQVFWRGIIDAFSVDTNLSASVDLYDINGIVAFPPGIISGSTFSSSNPSQTFFSIDMTTALTSVTGSGIIEARLWRTVSGSVASSATCRNARIDVEYV